VVAVSVTVIVIAGVVIATIGGLWYWRRKKRLQEEEEDEGGELMWSSGCHIRVNFHIPVVRKWIRQDERKVR